MHENAGKLQPKVFHCNLFIIEVFDKWCVFFEVTDKLLECLLVFVKSFRYSKILLGFLDDLF